MRIVYAGYNSKIMLFSIMYVGTSSIPFNKAVRVFHRNQSVYEYIDKYTNAFKYNYIQILPDSGFIGQQNWYAEFKRKTP